MKKLLLLSACLWLFTVQPSLAGDPDIVVVKVLESRLAARIIIARSWGIPEEMEVTAGLIGNEVTVGVETAKKLQQALTKLYEQGYVIKSSLGGEQGRSTLILVKEQ
jgi:hypothetical protein